MKTEELIIKVTQWANDRNITDGCPPIKQAYKTLEECGELIEAVALHKWADNHLSEEECTGSLLPVKDAIGDIVVTLIIQCAMQGIDFVDCLEGAYNTIKDRRGTLIGGKFVKEEDTPKPIYIPLRTGDIIKRGDMVFRDGLEWIETDQQSVGSSYDEGYFWPMRRNV